ncbi:unnamed protein product [Alopecurus aequalis]
MPPPKCKFYSWLAVLGWCLTADNLARRGWPHNPLCPLCCAAPETSPHLLAACPYARAVWDLVVDKASLPATLAPLPDTTSLEDWLLHSSQRLDKEKAKAWQSIVQLVWWSIWLERNNRVFKQRASTPAQLMHVIIAEARSWVQAGRSRVRALIQRPLEPD